MAAADAEGRKRLAGYTLRAPMSLQKMTYDAATGTVIYRSRMHAGLRRNFQVMPGAEWLALLCKQPSLDLARKLLGRGSFARSTRSIRWNAPSARGRCGSSP